MMHRWLAALVIVSGACGGGAAAPRPVANAPAPTPASTTATPKQLDALLADAGWRERYADATVRATDAQTFDIDTGTEQLTITTGAEAAQTFDDYHAQVLAAGMHVEQALSGVDDPARWELVASLDGSSVGAVHAAGPDGAVLCRFRMRGTEGWITPLGLCAYVLGILAPE